MLHFLCSAVAAQRLAVAVDHKRTYLLARTSGKTTTRPPVFVCRSKQVWIEVCVELDTTARVAIGKSVKNHFYVHCNLFVETVEYYVQFFCKL